MVDRLPGYYPLGIEADGFGRTLQRVRNHVARLALDLGDDTGPAQLWQATGYPSELRTGLQVLLHPNMGGMPLPGASAVAVFQGGHRGFGTIVGIEDGRYRGRNYQGGEGFLGVIDGAQANGTGGTWRATFEALLGWVAKISGKTVTIGDNTNTMTLTVTSAGSLEISGATGDVVVNGVSLVNHVHSNAGGSGDSGKPVQS